MTGAVDFFGLYLPWLMPLAALALLALSAVRRLLAWAGAARAIATRRSSAAACACCTGRDDDADDLPPSTSDLSA